MSVLSAKLQGMSDIDTSPSEATIYIADQTPSGAAIGVGRALWELGETLDDHEAAGHPRPFVRLTVEKIVARPGRVAHALGLE